jgi:hypothetical protein
MVETLENPGNWFCWPKSVTAIDWKYFFVSGRSDGQVYLPASMGRCLFLCAALLAAVLAAPASSLDTSTYSASWRVKLYHAFSFELTAGYVRSMFTRAGPVAGLGVAFFLIFVFWRLGRCWWRCCTQTKEVGRANPRACGRRQFLGIFAVLLSLAGVGMLIYGLM